MKRSELREVEYSTSSAKNLKGFFHTWITETKLEIGHREEYVGIHSTYALVEDIDGNVIKVRPENLVFKS